MEITHKNHYVPVWLQRGFMLPGQSQYLYLDQYPEKITLPNGKSIKRQELKKRGPKRCFWGQYLYTTLFFGIPNDEIEKYLFGSIDQFGVRAVRAILEEDLMALSKIFFKLFEFVDALKLRTPKELNWSNN